MAIYQYTCTNCKAKCEVMHQMKFVGDEKSLPEETQREITCNDTTCKSKLLSRKGNFTGEFFQRVPQHTNLGRQLNGSTVSDKELLADKQAKKKLRSKHHFKNTILPNFKDDQIKPHFEKKYKNTVKKDHEKL